MLNVFGILKNTPQQISANFTARVTANGGTLTAGQQTAVLGLVTNLQKYGLWEKMKVVYPFVGSSAAACAVNLVNGNYKATFSSGWTFATTGATPTGANTYMLANGFNPYLLLDPYNTSWSYYSRTNNTTNGFDLGVQNGFITTDRIAMSLYYAGSCYSDMNNSTLGEIATTTPSRLGLFSMSRSSTVFQQFFRNGAQIGSTNTTSMTASLPNANFTFGTISFNDGTNYISCNRQCAFAHAGTGMSAIEQLNFYNSVQAFQTALSRNV